MSADFDSKKRNSPLSIPAANTAVLLMDYQTFVMSNIGEEAARTVKVACELRDWALANKIPVYHCLIELKAGHPPDERNRFFDHWGSIEAGLGKMPQLGDEDKALAMEKDTDAEKTVLRKLGYVNVLLSRGLKEEFKAKQTKSLILAGPSTSGCVLSTARGAADEDYITTIVEDACYDRTAEVHDVMAKHGFPTSHVAPFKQLKEAWSTKS